MQFSFAVRSKTHSKKRHWWLCHNLFYRLSWLCWITLSVASWTKLFLCTAYNGNLLTLHGMVERPFGKGGEKQATLSNDSEFVLEIKLINSSANGKPTSFLKKENKKIMQLRKKSKLLKRNSINTIKINRYFSITLFAVKCNQIILWGWRHVTFILASQHYTHAHTYTEDMK